MPPSTLRDNLNSDFMKAYSALLPKHSAAKVLVYVEADEDIAFWRNVLHPYESQKISFDIQLPSKTDLSKGKQKVLQLVEHNLGPYLFACVDSDLDYILPNANDQSKLVIQSPYIFHTYTHSIENYLCFAPSLQKLCVQATLNDRKILDLEEWLKLYSKITHELFLWMIYFRSQQDHTSFTLSDFSGIVKILDKVEITDLGQKAMEGLQQRVESKLKSLKTDYPQLDSKVKDLGEEMTLIGLTEETAYLFIQGHTLLDNVVLMFLKPICSELVKEKHREIESMARSEDEHIAQKNYYRKRHTMIETIIYTNTEFQDCFLFQMLKTDLEKYTQAFS